MSEPEEIPEKRKIKAGDIDVTIDNAQSIRLAQENQKLKDDKEKLESVAERKLEMYKKTNDHRYLDCETNEDVVNLTTQLMQEVVQRKHEIPSGQAPLNSRQMGEKPFDIYTHKWANEKEMTDFLYAHHNEDTQLGRESDGYLTQMLRKWAHDFRTHPEHSQQFYNPNVKENLAPLKEFHGFLVPQDKTQTELGQLLEKWANENPARKRAKEQLEREKESR